MEEKKLVVAKQRFQALVESANEKKVKNFRGWMRLSKKPLLFRKKKQEEQILRQKGQLNYLGNQIAELGRKISEAQRNLAEAEAGLNDLNRLLRSRDKVTKEKWASEFGKLQGFSLVKAVRVLNGEIRVYTDTIYIKWYGRKYEIGNFLIKIDTKERNTDRVISIENLCNTSDCGRHHPYGYEDSDEFCFGNMDDELERLFDESDYLTMIEVILKALQTAEGDDSRYLIKKWKRVKK